MTWSRMRRNGTWRERHGLPPKEDNHGSSSSDEAHEEVLERVRVPEKPSLADEYEERLPIINWKYEVCRDTELAISVGDATPDQILAALERPDDDLIATYTKHYEDCLELCCHNHGIDPGTGKPDGRAAQLLLDAIADGASDQEALRYAYLAAHSKIPDQMMRDKQFQRRLAVARRTARKRKGSR